MTQSDYGKWLLDSRVGREELVAMKRQASGLGYLPLISLVLVVSDTDEVWIKASIDSVRRQAYPRLELCVCDNASERSHVSEVLEGYAAADRRVKVRRLPEEVSRSEAYNAAMEMAAGEFVALLGSGDELAPEALFRVAELLQRVRADVVYTDEDHIDISSTRSDPVFKPYWSPDLLLSTAYTGRLCVMRRSLVEASGYFREEPEGEQDLALRLSEMTENVHHLPEVLYHRRSFAEGPERGPGTSSPRAAEAALARRGTEATVEPGAVEGSFRVVRRVRGSPRVSVIVSALGGSNELWLVDALERQTSYPIHEVIVAGVGRGLSSSAGRVTHPFPARSLNLAAGAAEGEYLVFLDARARIATPGWLSEMLSQAQRPEAGVVGCKLLSPDGGLRHGGTLVEMSRLTGYPEEPVTEGGRYLPLVDHAFNFGAAPAECMMVRREHFEKTGGFDDANLPTAFYDLDLSFKLQETGLLNVYTPYARVIYGGVGIVPGRDEIEYVWNRWWARLVRLLYYQRSPLDQAHHGLEKGALFASPS
jgi:O-antigen biosynthesis protein